MKKESILEFSNRVYGLHISAELDTMRNHFCPSKGHYHCSATCSIYNAFVTKGLSCNEALDRYPDKCIQLIKYEKERDFS